MNRLTRAALPVLLLLPTLSPAAQSAEKPKKDNKAAQPSAVRDFVNSETGRLEGEVVGLIQQHAALAAGATAWLDLRIDSRILSRWVCQQLLNADPNSDTQAIVWLRYTDALSLSATLDAANLTAAPTPAQAAALAKIHKATFDLKDIENTADLDKTLSAFRDPLFAALNAGKPVDVRPAMPSVVNAGGAKESATTTDVPLTLDQMMPRVTQLSISAPLRQQLMAAISSAKAQTGEDAEKLTGALRDAIALASVLQTNLAVDPDARASMEQQLGEAIALYSDPRLRDAGQQRLAGLQEYRLIATRVAAMKLPPEMMKAFTPAVAYGRDHPESIDTILTTIRKFATLDAQMATKRPALATDAPSRAAEQQLKNYAVERAGLLGEVESMSGGGAFNVTPDNLADHVAKLQKIAQLYDLLKNLPTMQQQLLALKPKPTGGLEKRITQAVVHSANLDDPQQPDSTQLLINVAALAASWQAAQAEAAKPIADDPMHVYTGKSWAEANAALKQMATELTTSVAAGGEIDTAKLAALGRAPAVFEGVRRVAAITDKLGDAKGLARWADCNFDEKKLTGTLDAYQTDFSAIASATLTGTGDDKTLANVQKKYRGLLATLNTIAAVAPACEKIPADLAALLSRLTITSDHTPREASVRALCWTTDLIGLMQAAPDTDAAAIGKLRDRLLLTLNRAYPAAAAQ